MHQSLYASVIVAVALLTASCERASPLSPSKLPPSTDALIAALRQQGATVVPGDVLPPLPCLSANGQVMFVNTGVVNVFEYPTVADAESDAAKVSPDGSGVVGDRCSALITWVGPPHFYRSDRLIVVYAGSADAVLQPLENVLGKPFAQR